MSSFFKKIYQRSIFLHTTLRMKQNIIQMTATAGLTVPHLINPIFQYIFDCLGFNPMNGNFDFVFQGLNRL